MPKMPYAAFPREPFLAYSGIDLAERYSGIMMLDGAGHVAYEACPQDSNPILWIDQIKKLRARAVELGCTPSGQGLVVLIEDVYPGVAFSASYKPVVRLQGVLITLFHLAAPDAVLCWRPPASWQRAEGWPGGKKTSPGYVSTKMWAKQELQRRGYEPPAWTRGSKALEDIRDAALIAHHLYKGCTGTNPATLPRRVEAAPEPVVN